MCALAPQTRAWGAGGIRRAAPGLRRFWGLLEARTGHVEESVIAVLHVLEHPQQESALLTRRLELSAHELHLFTKGVHEILKRGRPLTFMHRCPRLFMSTVHGVSILFIMLLFLGMGRTVHGRPCTFFEPVHDRGYPDELGTIDHAIGGGTERALLDELIERRT